MSDGQNLGQHRHALFGTVFVISGHKHDVLALAGTLVSFVNHPWILSGGQRRHGDDSQDHGRETELAAEHDQFIPMKETERVGKKHLAIRLGPEPAIARYFSACDEKLQPVGGPPNPLSWQWRPALRSSV